MTPPRDRREEGLKKNAEKETQRSEKDRKKKKTGPPRLALSGPCAHP